MTNSIIVEYHSEGAHQVNILYSLEKTESLQTIYCSVASKHLPLWLQLRKFSISFIEEQGKFITLFSEINSSKNLDTALFIDLVYSIIMNQEHFKYS